MGLCSSSRVYVLEREPSSPMSAPRTSYLNEWIAHPVARAPRFLPVQLLATQDDRRRVREKEAALREKMRGSRRRASTDAGTNAARGAPLQSPQLSRLNSRHRAASSSGLIESSPTARPGTADGTSRSRRLGRARHDSLGSSPLAARAVTRAAAGRRGTGGRSMRVAATAAAAAGAPGSPDGERPRSRGGGRSGFARRGATRGSGAGNGGAAAQAAQARAHGSFTSAITADLRDSEMSTNSESSVVDKATGRIIRYSEQKMRRNGAIPAVYFQPSDFVKKALLGTGGYADVYLAQHRRNGLYYALKRIRRLDIVKRGLLPSLLSEITLLGTTMSPWTTVLFDVCQNDTDVFMVMQYVPGGELYNRMLSRDATSLVPMAEDVVRFYVVEMACALHALHSSGIVYRDLKPENVMIDERGHIMLVDFGFAKRLEPGDHIDAGATRVGTAQYMAPELQEVTHSEESDHSLDWWALGCVAFEMLTGEGPFGDVGAGDRKADVRRNVLRARPAWSKSRVPVDRAAKALVEQLLQRDKRRRAGFAEIKASAWMKDINWDAATSRKLKPPWVPGKMREGSAEHFKRSPKLPRPDMAGKLMRDELAASDVASCILPAESSQY